MRTPSIPKTIPYHLLEQVRERIISGRYPPGLSLREQMLEREFGSSRSPVRETLLLLEKRGLVIHSPRRGFRVREYSEQEIRDLYQLRALLEGEAVQSLERIEDISSLITDLRASNRRFAEHQDAGRVHEHLAENINFHTLIVRYGRNEPLVQVLAFLNEMAEPVRYPFLKTRIKESNAPAYHERMTVALEKRDFARARELMQEHIFAKQADVIKAYRAQILASGKGEHS